MLSNTNPCCPLLCSSSSCSFHILPIFAQQVLTINIPSPFGPVGPLPSAFPLSSYYSHTPHNLSPLCATSRIILLNALFHISSVMHGIVMALRGGKSSGLPCLIVVLVRGNRFCDHLCVALKDYLVPLQNKQDRRSSIEQTDIRLCNSAIVNGVCRGPIPFLQTRVSGESP